MKILLIDGQGGKLGKELCESILARFKDIELVAVGTNTIATSAMIKGGAKLCATGENAVVVNCRTADIIVGPIGIVIADSMLGEITPDMALAVSQSNAVKILIPANRCNNLIAGVDGMNVSDMINDALKKIENIIRK
ncbi:MAG: DUF3842 family protein [Ruminococcaceae bacterium]|nr:DUF3842 family protein [Oscillospiraceae bacterium]